MTNEKVIRSFLKHQEGHTPKRRTIDGDNISTLWTRENELINYRTVIAKWEGNTIKLNTKKYSSTTSKIQNMIERICEEYNIEIEVM